MEKYLPQIFTLSELNGRIRNSIRDTFSDSCWIIAEIGEMKENSFSHHCYLELLEKNAITHQICAKARAVIWSSRYPFIKYFFETQTGTSLSPGMKILVKISVDFHELYGLSFSIEEIDPSFTIGEMYLQKAKIIAQLQEEGIFSMNKELSLPMLPTKIAVISSPTAAGYGDFMTHLENSRWKDHFAIKLFAATMQGEQTAPSVIRALDLIHKYVELFDAVVIIRGGGAMSDLNSFDVYDLAANCAQFPLPILTGIGHERDDTIVDMVAHTRLKTPTAVADFLIERMDEGALQIESLSQTISSSILHKINEMQQIIHILSTNIIRQTTVAVAKQHNTLFQMTMMLKDSIFRTIDSFSFRIKEIDQYFHMASPSYILKKGYALVLKDGKIVESSHQLKKAEEVELRFDDGSKNAVIQ